MRRFLIALGVLGVMAAPSTATAGAYADGLAKCMIKAMTPEDRAVYLLWTMSALGQHPAAQGYFTMTDDQRESVAAQASAMMQRLLLVDCRSATIEAIKHEGTAAFPPAFSALDDAALEALMKDPGVTKALRRPMELFDKSEFEALLKEGGLPVKGQAGAPAR